MKKIILAMTLIALISSACSEKNHPYESDQDEESVSMDLGQVAKMLSSLSIGTEQLEEVYTAVSSSSSNGYDEEYTMKDLFSSPGSGVGDISSKSSSKHYSVPLRSLIEDYLSKKSTTRAGSVDMLSVSRQIEYLEDSGTQIYWPYSEEWDGETMPVITFDPGTEAESNIGYRIDDSGSSNPQLQTVVVTEEYAMSHPVWVVNTNSDSAYTTLEIYRRDNPDWTEGGTIRLTSESEQSHPLIMRKFLPKRSMDPWFAGASEFVIKCGSLDNFKAMSESELWEYRPSVTSLMLVVKRKDIGKEIDCDTILITNVTDQLEEFVFMVREDDGGTITSWNMSGSVKIKSKSYGFDVQLPVNTRDDVVWEGNLATSFLRDYNNTLQNFGDVKISFELL